MTGRLSDDEYRAWIDAGSPNALEAWTIITALRAERAKLEAALWAERLELPANAYERGHNAGLEIARAYLAQPAESGATMACPICGIDTPHTHTAQEKFDHDHKKTAKVIASKPWHCPKCNWVNAFFTESCCRCAEAKP